MAITTQMRTDVANLYVALFGRAPERDGLGYWVQQLDAGKPLTAVAQAMYNVDAARAFYPTFLTNDEIIGKFYTNVLGRTADAEGLAYWSAKLTAGARPGQVITEMITSVQAYAGTDAAALASKALLANKVTVGLYYAVDLGGNDVTGATTILQNVTSVASSVDTAKTTAATSAGSTFTLTTAIDTLSGTSGNDAFVADNAALSAADSINGGAGTDTVKIYGISAANALLLPALTSVEKVYMNGAAASLVYDASTNTGITSVELDGQLGTAATVKVTTGQAVTLSNNTAATFTTTISGNTPTSLGLTLTNIGNTTGTVDTIDFSGTALATLNITGATTKSSASLTNTGLKITTINVDGAANVTLTEDAAMSTAVTKINAATATGAVSVNTTAGAKVAGFAFTGGSGNDTLKLKAGDLGVLTAGSQLDGGAGTGDKIVTLDTTFAAADYAKLNATKGFEVLGTGAAAAVVDGSQLTSIKSFAVDGDGIQAYSNMATGSSVSVSVAHAAALGLAGAVGVSDLNLSIGSAATAGFTIGGNLTIGQTTVAMSSNGTNAAANIITALLNADNSTYTITGSNDLTLTAIRATAIGSKIDGTALTGKLNVTGNTAGFSAGSSLGDVLIGGAAADTLKASVNGGSLTGNAGADTFDVSAALGGVTATYQTTTVTDFTKGDMLKFAAGTAGAFTAAKVDLSAAASVGAALDILAAGNNADLKWGVYNGNTYIIDDVGAGATFAATDTMVKLSGVLDLSTSTFAAGVLTFA